MYMIGMKYQCTVCQKYHESVDGAISCKEECLKKKDNRNVIDVYKYWKTEMNKQFGPVRRNN